MRNRGQSPRKRSSPNHLLCLEGNTLSLFVLPSSLRSGAGGTRQGEEIGWSSIRGRCPRFLKVLASSQIRTSETSIIHIILIRFPLNPPGGTFAELLPSFLRSFIKTQLFSRTAEPKLNKLNLNRAFAPPPYTILANHERLKHYIFVCKIKQFSTITPPHSVKLC